MTKRYVALILALILSLTLLPAAMAETAEPEKISYWADMNANMAQTISNLDENLTWQKMQERGKLPAAARKRLHRLPREGRPGQQPARADSALRRGGLRAAAAAAGGGNPSAVREAVYRLFAVCHGREDLCAGSQGAASQRPLTRAGRINSLRRPHGVSGSFFVRLDARAAVPARRGRSPRDEKKKGIVNSG